MAWDYEKIMRELQETVTVMAGIQSRLESGLKSSVEWLETLQRAQELHKERMAEHDRKMEEHDRKMAQIDERLHEMTEKLDAMIHITDDHLRDDHMHGGPPPQQHP